MARNVSWSLRATAYTLLACGACIGALPQSLHIAVALLGTSVGAAFWWWSRLSCATAVEHLQSAPATEPLRPAMREYVDALGPQLAASAEEITRTRTALLEAIARLAETFDVATRRAREQQTIALSLAAGKAAGNGAAGDVQPTGFDELTKETSTTLQFFVDAAVHNSKLAVGLIELVEKVRVHAGAIKGALK
jgi:hypothetical protein